MMKFYAVPHKSLSEKLDVSAAQVSRIRSGVRHPSVRVMRVISELLDWPIEEQIQLRATTPDLYHEELNYRIDSNVIKLVSAE